MRNFYNAIYGYWIRKTLIMLKFILINDAIPLAGLMVTELGKNISGTPLKQKRSVWF